MENNNKKTCLCKYIHLMDENKEEPRELGEHEIYTYMCLSP